MGKGDMEFCFDKTIAFRYMHSAIVQTTPAEGFNMLDLDWERYVPLMDIHIDDIQKIFAQYDKTLTVSGFEAIRLGCRNSNYAVGTNRGKFLLRVTNSADFNNEPVAYRLVKDRVTIPALLFHTTAPYGRIFI